MRKERNVGLFSVFRAGGAGGGAVLFCENDLNKTTKKKNKNKNKNKGERKNAKVKDNENTKQKVPVSLKIRISAGRVFPRRSQFLDRLLAFRVGQHYGFRPISWYQRAENSNVGKSSNWRQSMVPTRLSWRRPKSIQVGNCLVGNYQ